METADPGSPKARPCVLIVDDVPANLGVLLEFLSGEEYEILVAESGEGALSQLEYARPDIILLDVNMPGINGYETCRRLKAQERWRDIPVFFLTAQSEPVDKLKGFRVGAVDYITKPLHPEEVLARVRAHLQIRALRRELEAKNSLLEKAMELRREAEEQLQQSLEQAVLVVQDGDQIRFCTRRARTVLARYFPEQPDPNTLPASLTAWARSPSGQTSPWRCETSEARLEVHLFTTGTGQTSFMLTFEDTPKLLDSPGPLLQLGLTGREAEVLYWIAHGKTNPEIAVILQAALNTIKKHVQNILLKLGVETRLAAALRAAEILGLGAVDPGRIRSEWTGADRAG